VAYSNEDKEESVVSQAVDQRMLKGMMTLKLALFHFELSILCAGALAEAAGRQGKSCILSSI
jgi:hypothetical protein